MASVDPLYAQWLEAETLWTLGEDAAGKGRWGTAGLATQRATTIATKADADVEAARQLAFLSGPLAEEEHLLIGAWAGYLGQLITLTIDQLGYGAGLTVFVTAVTDDRATGVSTVTVLRRL